MQNFGPWLPGSTVPFQTHLELAPRRSRLALMLWLGAAIGVTAGLWSLGLSWWLLVPLVIVLFLGGRDLVWSRSRSRQEILSWDGRSWRLVRGNNETTVVDCRWEFVSRPMATTISPSVSGPTQPGRPRSATRSPI